MDSYKKPYMKRIEIEAEEKWRELSHDMPFLSFSADFEFSVIPPFGGATARLLVRKKRQEKTVSIYCDHYNALGFMDGPYWEAWLGDETERFMLGDEASLVSAVETYLNKLGA